MAEKRVFLPAPEDGGRFRELAQKVDDARAEESTRRVLAAVRQERDNLAALIDSIGDEIWFADAKGRLRLANAAARRTFGLNPVADMDIEAFAARQETLRPDGSPRPIAEAPLLRALAGETLRDVEVIVRTPESGELRHRLISSSPVRDARGQLLGAVAVGRDVTDQCLADKELQRAHAELEKRVEERTAELAEYNEQLWREIHIRGEAEGALRALMDAIPEAAFLMDREGRVVQTNAETARRFGVTAEELPRRNILDMLSPEVRAFRQPHIAGVFRSGQPAYFADSRAGRDIESHVYPVFDSNGAVRYVAILEVDITERKQSEDRLRESERRYRLLADNSEDVIWTMDLDCHCTYISPAVTRLRGFSAEEAMAQTVAETLTPASVARAQAALAEELAYEKAPDGRPHYSRILEIEYLCKDGGAVWTEVNATFLRDERNRPCGIIGATRNISERKRLEREILDAKEAAEAANRAKTAFLANMSHELRTPLNAILGFAQILTGRMAGELNEMQAQYSENILTSGAHLLQLVNDLLDFSKVEAGKMELAPSWTPLDVLLADVANTIYGRARLRALKLTLLVSPELKRRTIWADERKLRQILYNLLGNAVKFTPAGGAVELHAEERAGELIFSVTDTGIGIAPEDQARIFNVFEQVDSGPTRRHQGAGLGLALSRRLVELHGGRIWVASEGAGRGSTFSFTIPVRTVDSGRLTVDGGNG
jgi:PAS domain S-box-containing protein